MKQKEKKEKELEQYLFNPERMEDGGMGQVNEVT